MTAAATLPRPGWQARAVCCAIPGDGVFFPPQGLGEAPQSRAAREKVAKALCAGCPVAAACRAFARASGEPFGIWGGETERERWVWLHPGRPVPRRLDR